MWVVLGGVHGLIAIQGTVWPVVIIGTSLPDCNLAQPSMPGCGMGHHCCTSRIVLQGVQSDVFTLKLVAGLTPLVQAMSCNRLLVRVCVL